MELNRAYEEEPVNRRRGDDTPRRYEQPMEADDPVMPAGEATMNTKI